MRPCPSCFLLASMALSGCSEWPRFANLPQDTAEPVLAGTTVATPVTWIDGATLTVPSLRPGEASSLPPGLGLLWQDRLLGAGTTAADTGAPAVDTGCGLASDHPPVLRGAYAGQSLWTVMAPEAVGTLCATAWFDDPAVLVDLLVYDLSQCGVPQGPWLDPDSAAVVGLGGTGGRVAWRLPVVAGAPLGLALAAAEPQDPDGDYPHRLAVTLVARAVGGEDGACPVPPEGLP